MASILAAVAAWAGFARHLAVAAHKGRWAIDIGLPGTVQHFLAYLILGITARPARSSASRFRLQESVAVAATSLRRTGPQVRIRSRILG